MNNLWIANRHRYIGYEDANQTLNELMKNLNREVFIEKKDLESLLWASNLLYENELFWHPNDLAFTVFIKDVLKRRKFDFQRHLIDENG